MEKLYGLLLSLLTLFTGVWLYVIGFAPSLAGAAIITSIGLSLFFERKIIKESSTKLEKAISTIIPVTTELLIVFALISQTSYLLESAVYLGLVLFSTDLLNRFDELFKLNKSRLLGRIARVLILSLGLAVSGLNSYIVFYAIASAGLIAVYDIGIILSESWSGI